MLSEAQFLDRVVDLAERTGWAVHHDRPARRAGAKWATAIQGHAGFPDLVLARRGVVLFRELKGYQASGRIGRLSSEQRDWAAQLAGPARYEPHDRLTALFDVWTPDDWDPVIVPTLTARTVQGELEASIRRHPAGKGRR